MFLSAAGCNDITPEEFTKDFKELSCEVAVECGFREAQDCSSKGRSLDSKCEAYNADAAKECIKELEVVLDDVEDASGARKEAICMDRTPSVCSKAVTATNASGCAVDGRPVFVEGALALAAVTSGDGWSQTTPSPGPDADQRAAAEHWLHMARTEHASVAAFARLSLELMSLGAPPSLVSRCHRAAQQEIEHATACLGHARRLGGAQHDLGPLRGVVPRSSITLQQLAIESLIEGCIGEGAAAVRAGMAAEHSDEETAATLRKIHDDEVQHAATSWAMVRWALDRDPTLIPQLRHALSAYEVAAPETATPTAAMRRLGVYDSRQAARQSATFIAEVVWPVFEMLVGRLETSAHAASVA